MNPWSLSLVVVLIQNKHYILELGNNRQQVVIWYFCVVSLFSLNSDSSMSPFQMIEPIFDSRSKVMCEHQAATILSDLQVSWHNCSLVFRDDSREEGRCDFHGRNFAAATVSRKPASPPQGRAITILIQSVFFSSVRSSELSGAGPAVPTSCGNRPSDRYADTPHRETSSACCRCALVRRACMKSSFIFRLRGCVCESWWLTASLGRSPARWRLCLSLSSLLVI